MAGRRDSPDLQAPPGRYILRARSEDTATAPVTGDPEANAARHGSPHGIGAIDGSMVAGLMVFGASAQTAVALKPVDALVSRIASAPTRAS